MVKGDIRIRFHPYPIWIHPWLQATTDTFPAAWRWWPSAAAACHYGHVSARRPEGAAAPAACRMVAFAALVAKDCHTDARWQFLWYRLVFPTGTNNFFLFFPNPILFVIFITVYFFIMAKHTQALQYYTFFGRSCSFSENIWN